VKPNANKPSTHWTPPSPHWTLSIVLAIAALSCSAQTPTTPPSTPAPPTTFEAASIRRNLSGSNGTHIDFSHDRLTITNGSLRTLIRIAYDIQNYQFAGGPAWLDSDMYDVSATTGTAGDTSDDQFRALTRTLLADRFQLKIHWETRQANIFALIAAKSGPTLKVDPDPTREPGVNTNITSHEGKIVGTNAPVSYLASVLANKLGHPVLDKTGLPGKYDWTLTWDPDPTADSTNPGLSTALEEQLGLKLDPQKGPAQFLVIDSASHPSEN